MSKITVFKLISVITVSLLVAAAAAGCTPEFPPDERLTPPTDEGYSRAEVEKPSDLATLELFEMKAEKNPGEGRLINELTGILGKDTFHIRLSFEADEYIPEECFIGKTFIEYQKRGDNAYANTVLQGTENMTHYRFVLDGVTYLVYPDEKKCEKTDPVFDFGDNTVIFLNDLSKEFDGKGKITIGEHSYDYEQYGNNTGNLVYIFLAEKDRLSDILIYYRTGGGALYAGHYDLDLDMEIDEALWSVPSGYTVDDKRSSAGQTEIKSETDPLWDESVGPAVTVNYKWAGEGETVEAQTTDPGIISELTEAVNNIRTGDKTDYRIADDSDILTFRDRDGGSFTLTFEGGMVLKDGVLYETEGYRELKRLFMELKEKYSGEKAEESYEPFTDQELADMDTVGDRLRALTDSEVYNRASLEERRTMAVKLLNELADDGLVIRGSILAEEDNDSISFSYSSGVLGGIMLREWDPMMN